MTITMGDLLDEASTPEAADGEPTRDELLAVIANQQAIIAERWPDSSLLRSWVEDTGFRALLHTPFGSLLADFCGETLRTERAVNFIALDVENDRDGAMVFSVHRKNGNSPTEQLARTRTERDALKAERDALAAKLAVVQDILTEAAARAASAGALGTSPDAR